MTAEGQGAAHSRARHIHIAPSRGIASLTVSARELWEFRDLLLLLALRDVKLRYKQTALGIVWVILQPLLSSVVFAIVFGRVARLPSDGVPYLLFVYAGILPWNFFASSLQRAGNSLITDSRLISKVYFPRMIIPIASTLAVLLDFCVSSSVMVALMILYRVPPTFNLLALPFILLIVVVTATGVSLGLSALTVYYRDFAHVLPFLVQIWMYASPLVYSGTMVPAKWKTIYALNPLAGVIDGFRWALLARTSFPWLSLGLAAVMAALFFFMGTFIFRRVERSFADVI